MPITGRNPGGTIVITIAALGMSQAQTRNIICFTGWLLNVTIE
jgi:hypothetical protein